MSETILFADSTSVISSSRNFDYFCSVSNLVISNMIKCFLANKLVLNSDKMNIMKCISNNSVHSTLHRDCKERYTEESVNRKFLCLQIDNHIHWRKHNEELIPKLSASFYRFHSIVLIR
jgi:hypothetical protein